MAKNKPAQPAHAPKAPTPPQDAPKAPEASNTPPTTPAPPESATPPQESASGKARAKNPHALRVADGQKALAQAQKRLQDAQANLKGKKGKESQLAQKAVAAAGETLKRIRARLAEVKQDHAEAEG